MNEYVFFYFMLLIFITILFFLPFFLFWLHIFFVSFHFLFIFPQKLTYFTMIMLGHHTLLFKPTSSRSDSECNVACGRRTTGKPSSGQMRPARIWIVQQNLLWHEHMNETRNQKSDCDQVKKWSSLWRTHYFHVHRFIWSHNYLCKRDMSRFDPN